MDEYNDTADDMFPDDAPPLRCSCGQDLMPFTMTFGSGPYIEEILIGWAAWPRVDNPDKAYYEGLRDYTANDHVRFWKDAAEAYKEADRDQVAADSEATLTELLAGWNPVHDILNSDGTIRIAGTHIGAEVIA